MNKASDESVRLLEVHAKVALLVIVLRLKFYKLNPQLGGDIAGDISELCHFS